MVVWFRRNLVFKRRHNKEKAFYWLSFSPILSLSFKCRVKVTSILCESISFSTKGYSVLISIKLIEIRLEFLFQHIYFFLLPYLLQLLQTGLKVSKVFRSIGDLEIQVGQKKTLLGLQGRGKMAGDSHDSIPPSLFLLIYPLLTGLRTQYSNLSKRLQLGKKKKVLYRHLNIYIKIQLKLSHKCVFLQRFIKRWVLGLNILKAKITMSKKYSNRLSIIQDINPLCTFTMSHHTVILLVKSTFTSFTQCPPQV